MNKLEWPKLDLIRRGGFKNGQTIMTDYTLRFRGKSLTEKLSRILLASRCGSKTNTIWFMWEDECDKVFLHKQRKLLQSKSKQSRIISVVCK